MHDILLCRKEPTRRYAYRQVAKDDETYQKEGKVGRMDRLRHRRAALPVSRGAGESGGKGESGPFPGRDITSSSRFLVPIHGVCLRGTNGPPGPPSCFCESHTRLAKRAACTVQHIKIMKFIRKRPEGTFLSKSVPADTLLNAHQERSHARRANSKQ